VTTYWCNQKISLASKVQKDRTGHKTWEIAATIPKRSIERIIGGAGLCVQDDNANAKCRKIPVLVRYPHTRT